MNNTICFQIKYYYLLTGIMPISEKEKQSVKSHFLQLTSNLLTAIFSDTNDFYVTYVLLLWTLFSLYE